MEATLVIGSPEATKVKNTRSQVLLTLGLRFLRGSDSPFPIKKKVCRNARCTSFLFITI